MLLLTESCDFGLDRWVVFGNITTDESFGINKTKGIFIPSEILILKNKIRRSFRTIENSDEKRDFRLSFWIKIDGKITEESEFISIISQRQQCGAMIGINNLGHLYAKTMFAIDVPGYMYTKDNMSHPNLMDGNYHYVEIYAKYDADWTGAVKIFVDNALYINQVGMNLTDDFGWTRPDTITFGNLIGADLYLDDIILWDDLGSDYIGYRGSTVLNSKKIIETSEELYGIKDKLFDINTVDSMGSLISMTVASTEAKDATVKPISIVNGQKTEGKEKDLLSTKDVYFTMFVEGGKENVKVGVERIS